MGNTNICGSTVLPQTVSLENQWLKTNRHKELSGCILHFTVLISSDVSFLPGCVSVLCRTVVTIGWTSGPATDRKIFHSQPTIISLLDMFYYIQRLQQTQTFLSQLSRSILGRESNWLVKWNQRLVRLEEGELFHKRYSSQNNPETHWTSQTDYWLGFCSKLKCPMLHKTSGLSEVNKGGTREKKEELKILLWSKIDCLCVIPWSPI